MGFFSRPRSRSGFCGSRFRPTLERLEDRDCPTSMSLSISQSGAKGVVLSGQVTNPNPGAGVIIQFSGSAYHGQAVTGADGSFSVSGQADNLGTIYAAAMEDGSTLATAQVQVTSQAPSIANFQAVRGVNNYYTFSGQVNDEYPPGLVVTFGGLQQLIGQTATVWTNNCFSITVQLCQGETATVSAQVTDWWGLPSNPVYDYVSVS
jgi:hypothetical protein